MCSAVVLFLLSPPRHSAFVLEAANFIWIVVQTSEVLCRYFCGQLRNLLLGTESLEVIIK